MLLLEKARLRKTAILYHVDVVVVESGRVTVMGWGISIEGKVLLDYKICTENGQEIESRCKRIKRPDALHSVLNRDGEEACGFEIRFSYEQGKRYFLMLENEKGVEKCLINIKKAQRAKQREDKPSLPKMLKSCNIKNWKAEKKLRKEFGREALRQERLMRYSQGKKDYNEWYLRHKADVEELCRQRQIRFPYEPLISIIVPAYKTPSDFLYQMVNSVQRQSYGNWELCIADGSEEDSVRKAIQPMLKDKRIRYKLLEKNYGISGNTNAALRLATGDIIMLLDHDDLLAPEALFEFVKAFNQDPEIEVVYSDEDKVSSNLRHYSDPYFKPDFNLDLLRSNNYICHLFAVKRHIVELVGDFRGEFDGSQDFDFTLRCTEQAKRIYHIPKILYHWRMSSTSTAADAENKMYCYEAGKRAIMAHLERSGIRGEVGLTEHLGHYYVDYELKKRSLVSILIPNRDEKECLKRCIDSIVEKTTYRNFEIIVIENNSKKRETFDYYEEVRKNPQINVIIWKDDFNYSAINNFGVKAAKGEYYVLLNNDTEVIEPRWLEIMLADCQREDIGIVGSKLLYPDNTVQHGGVVIGLGGVAGHIFGGIPAWVPAYFAWSKIQRDVSAVTAACLMVSAELYGQIGGFDEQLRVAYNDVDFCLKARKAGKLVLWEPRALLYHYESKSRGADNTSEKRKRLSLEADFIKARWGELIEAGDPYYNPNLTLSKDDLSLR